MIKKFLKLSAVLFTILLLSTTTGLASGKMEVKLGEKVNLQADGATGYAFKWVVKKGKDIVTTQASSVFDYTFDQQGEYDVGLTSTDSSGKTKNTHILVLVGDRYSPVSVSGVAEGGSLDSPFNLTYETLPTQTAQHTIHLLGQEGNVVFDMTPQDGVLEYRVDRNIFADSDGNGIANDDIDNASSSSYLLGGVWQTKYTATESKKITAEITAVNGTGEKAKSQVEIVFDPVPDKKADLLGVLDTLPPSDPQSGKIQLYGTSDTVAFYGSRSQGDALEYRIDKNIFIDSDGDGNPENDIDNRTDPSFKTGDVWVTSYEKTDQQVIAQLIVVGKGGVGSRIQREIVFGDKRPVIVAPAPVAGETKSGIQLVADKDFVQKGDPVQFMVQGLTRSLDSYIFDWDFNGDGKADQTVEGNNKVTYLYDVAGIQPVKVHVHDVDGNEANFSLDFLVKDIAVTTADFDFTVEKNKVTFTNLSVTSANLTSKVLTYTWSFGDTDPDNYNAQKDQISVQSPVYSYKKPGTYIVTLTVVDSDKVTSTKKAEVVVKEGSATTAEKPAETPKADVTPTKTGGSSILWTIVKVILYIILVILLLILFIVSGLLIFLKVQHPDLIFEELIDELKIKLLGMMGIHDAVEPHVTASDPQSLAATYEASARAKPAPKPAASAEPAPQEEVAPKKPLEPHPEPEPGTPVKEAELAKPDAPMPDWLKKTTPAQVSTEKPAVIEGEVVESTSSPATAPQADTAPSEPKTDAPVPDWLKNV